MGAARLLMKNISKSGYIECIAYFLVGAVTYLIARLLVFYNPDEVSLLSSSQYCLKYGMPWSVAWPLADCILSRFIPLTGNSFNSITLFGALISGLGSTITGTTIGRLSGQLSLARWSALLTGMWLVSPAGGWIVDSLSYSIGMTPGFWFINNRYCNNRWSAAIVAGSCMSIGLLLKWNSFAPAYACTLFYILGKSYQKFKTTRDILSTLAIFTGSALVTSVVCSALLHLPTIYGETINFYYNLRDSPVEKGFAPSTIWGKLSFPFKLDFYSAIIEKRSGDLYFLPVWMAYWFSIIVGVVMLLRERFSESLRFGLYLLVSTGLSGFTLGRGMNHRLLLIPIGLLLVAHNLERPAVRKECIKVIKLFFTGGWLVLSLQQTFSTSGLEARDHWNFALKASSNRQLCIDEKKLLVKQLNTLEAWPQKSDSLCFDRNYISDNFSAMGVMSIPNELEISLKQATSRVFPLREEWNSKTLSYAGRIWLANNIIRQIHKNRSSYLLESYSSTILSGELPASWAKGRSEVFALIKQRLRLQYLGEHAGQTLWKVDNSPIPTIVN